MTRARNPSSKTGVPVHTEAGFALVDALVSLVLVAMILALLPGSVRTGQRAWQAAISQDGTTERAAALSIIAQWLESALPVFERDADGLAQIAFSGDPESVTFVTSLSDGPVSGGLYRLTLRPQQAGSVNSRSLVLTLSPFQRQSSEPGIATVDHTVLDNIENTSFRYYGSIDTKSDSVWHTTWARTDQLPSLIEMSIYPAKASTSRQQTVRVAFKMRAGS